MSQAPQDRKSQLAHLALMEIEAEKIKFISACFRGDSAGADEFRDRAKDLLDSYFDLQGEAIHLAMKAVRE